MSGARVVVAQLGARRHYLVPRALAGAGCLERFYTDFYYGRRPIFDRTIANVLRRQNGISGRCHPGVPPRLVTDFPYATLAPRRRRSQTATWIATGTRFCRSIVRRGFGRADTVLAFSSAAQELFEAARAAGLRTVLDHATAPRRQEMAAVTEEAHRFPGWVAMPPSSDPDADVYSERQARERDLAHYILCGSTFAARLLEAEGVAAGKIRVVPLGLDQPFPDVRRSHRTAGALNVLFVGNEGLRKGLGYLLEAVRTLGSRRIRLRIAGDPGFNERGMAEVHRNADACRSVPRAELPAWYDWADVLVLPTVSDTFGLVILEAMSSGLPVITTPASGGPDVIRHGIDGWIVPVRDSVSIAERLDELASTPDLASSMGLAAQQRARDFDVDAYGRRLLCAITDN